MKIDAIRLHNVKRFTNRGVAIEGIGEGVNVLCAENEHGKSTTFEALSALFFESHSSTAGPIKLLRPHAGGSPVVEADITTAKGRYRLRKRFYGAHREAVIEDLERRRVVAQADEAEELIRELTGGGAGGPHGLLWVRQGITGYDTLTKKEQAEERQARHGVLTSVQGEVAAITGGQRMARIMDACEAELERYLTPQRRVKAGGPLAVAMAERDRLAEAEAKLQKSVDQLHEDLEARRKAYARRSELADPSAEAERRVAVEKAEAVLAEARAHADRLSAAEATSSLAQAEHQQVRTALEVFLTARRTVEGLAPRLNEARGARDAAAARRDAADEAGHTAAAAVTAAESDEQAARELLDKLDRALKAREAAQRAAELRGRLAQAEAARADLETAKAARRSAGVPAKVVAELEDVEIEIAGLRAAAGAALPIVSVDYLPGRDGTVRLDGVPLPAGETRAASPTLRLDIAGVGAIAVRTRRTDLDGAELGAAEARRAALLASLGVGSLAEARDRQAAAQRLAGEADLAERRLDTFAPRGIDDLRAEIARSDAEARTSAEAEGDPAEARISHQRAADRLAPLRFTATRTRAERDAAAAALIEAERALHTLEAELSAAETALGPADARADRETALAAAAARAEAEARTAKAQVDQLRAGAPDIEAAEASLRRLRSARDVAASEGNALAEKLASLDGRISALSQQSVEEELAETSEKRLAADLQVARWKAEADALSRLVDALQKARTEARDQYLSPVMRELKPLLGLVLPGAEIAFDGESLLPQTITRNGQEEDVEVLSGGMREQLSILTRLAFARLLASRGAPTPVILDDALVYSDDDRIERMFDVLHRQSRDQQIIVFSCRQRAFAKLGGTTLQFSDWAGPE